MNILFVVSQQEDWPADIPGITVVPAQTYLMDPAYGDSHSTKVINLCRSTRYQSHGYYVSLLAEARGHQPLPSVEAIRRLQSERLLPELGERLGDLIDCAFARADGDAVELDIHFGHDAGRSHPHLAEQLFRLLRAPLLRARFERVQRHWRLDGIAAGSVLDLDAAQREAVAQAAIDYLKEQKIRANTPPGERPSLAILHDPRRPDAPSNPLAMRKFREAAEMLGMRAQLVTPEHARRLSGFDALFIRDTTGVNHYTYQASQEAADAGLVVIDDPDSILRCTNKIYLNELLTRHHIPTLKTLAVHHGNVDRIVPALGLPCILKQPDGAFSLGVAKVESESQLQGKVEELLRASELILAQQYLPTEFDWRVAVLDRRPLFVCKYHMAPGHWQIIKREQRRTSEGRVEALSIGEAPDEVIGVALQAAGLIGDGFYGVDIKQAGGQCYVIEINDNPNVDAGNEDALLGDALYREVMGVFRKRIDARKGSSAP